MEREVVPGQYPSATGRGKVASREVRYDLGGAVDVAGGVHAQPIEDAPLQKFTERLAADLLDDAAQQHEAGIAVEITRTGREIQPILPANAGEQVLGLARLAEI